MAMAVRHFLTEYPVHTLEEGDSLISNDPWLTSGHLNDFTVVTPIFQRGELVALFANTCHAMDIGGRTLGADAREVFEEGLYVPRLKWCCACRGAAASTTPSSAILSGYGRT